MKKLSSELIFSLKLVVSAVLIGVVVRNVDLGNVLSVVVSVPLWYWFASILLMFLAQAIAAKRWHMVSDHVPFRTLLRLTLVSNVYAFMIPSVFTADAARLVAVPKSEDGWTGATSRLVVDKVIGLVPVFVLGLPAMLVSTSIQLRHLFLPSLVFVSAFTIVITIIRRQRFHKSISRFKQELAGRSGKKWRFLSNILIVVLNTRLNLPNRVMMVNGLLALSFQLIMVMMLALGAYVCAISIKIQDLLVLSAATQLAFLVPVGVGGVGVKDVTQVAVLVMFGVSQQSAVAMVSLGYPVLLSTVLVGGILLNVGSSAERPDLEEA